MLNTGGQTTDPLPVNASPALEIAGRTGQENTMVTLRSGRRYGLPPRPQGRVARERSPLANTTTLNTPTETIEPPTPRGQAPPTQTPATEPGRPRTQSAPPADSAVQRYLRTPLPVPPTLTPRTRTQYLLREHPSTTTMPETSDFTYETNSSTLAVEEPSLLGNTPTFPEYPQVPAPTPVVPTAPVYRDAEDAWAGVYEFRNAIREGQPINVALLRSQQAVRGYISESVSP